MGEEPVSKDGEVSELILAALRGGPAPPDAVAAATGLDEHVLIAEVGWLVFAGRVTTDRVAPRTAESPFPFGPLALAGVMDRPRVS